MNDPHGHIHAPRDHAHAHAQTLAPRAVALAPTWSLMRLSALQRLVGAGVILALVWAALARLLGWF